ncbi:hypothetical protein YW7DRAFT_06987 [Streptomyces sp. AmelKG-E11A]|nr:hypothetical protein YW7DRAFT_06987 [Streptomyces sp. AmelKG-E11A]
MVTAVDRGVAVRDARASRAPHAAAIPVMPSHQDRPPSRAAASAPTGHGAGA